MCEAVHTSPPVVPLLNQETKEGDHMTPKVAVVGIVLAMTWTMAMATLLNEAIPIFYPQFLLVF